MLHADKGIQQNASQIPMKNFRLVILTLLLALRIGTASAQGTVEQLKTYMAERDKIKTLDLAALKAITDNRKETNVRRGLAEYYVFLKTPVADGDAAAGTQAANALEKAADLYMDACTYVKLAGMYSQDYPGYGVKRDETKLLRYLSTAWEIGDLSDKATGDNAVLTLIVNNTLGLGDGVLGSGTADKPDLKKTLDAIRPDVLKARARFKKLYGLSVKDETPGSTNLERHYGQ